MTAYDNTIVNILHRNFSGLFQRLSIPRWLVFMFDSFSVYSMFLFAYLLRYNMIAADFDFVLSLYHGVVTLAVYSIFTLLFRSYSGLIRHTTIKDIFLVFITCTVSLIILFFISLLARNNSWAEFLMLPFSILVIHYVAITAWLVLFRIVTKMFFELITTSFSVRKNVLIFGAGRMAVIVMKVITGDQSSGYQIAGLLDNNKFLQRKKLDGIRVYSPKVVTREFLKKRRIDTMIFAIQNIPATEKRDIISNAIEQGLEVLELPAVDSWLNGQFQVRQLQKVKLEDLLGRDPIKLNMKILEKALKGRSILVTGAAGSIGSEIVRQLTRFSTGKLILLDNAETPMFHLENELSEKYVKVPVNFLLADVTDQVKMDRIFREYKPDIVFHAAAYKHVPMMEENPSEAIRVNVGGTMFLTKLSVKYGIKKFVMVSTDKAVNPTNVMGASKRICEMILQSRSLTPGNRTQFVVTRFGNVLGSSGSVIPIFTKQIAEGGPVTVTHPEITRYFMTIPEACQLVLEAGFMGMGGEIFIFDMGEPMKIDNLAKQMIRLSGLIPGKDVKIEYIGLRPGEKLYEELLAGEEKTLPTYNPKVQVAEAVWMDHKKFLSSIHALLLSYFTLNDQEVIEKIRGIVPEYDPTNGILNGAEEDSGPGKVEKLTKRS